MDAFEQVALLLASRSGWCCRHTTLLQGGFSIAAPEQEASLSLARDGEFHAPGAAIFCAQSQHTRH